MSITLHEIDPGKLLRGEYERDRLPKDFSADRAVPDYAFNVLNPAGLLYRPVVDERHLAGPGRRPAWPGGKRFAVCLTHDVDAVTEYSVPQSMRAFSTPASRLGRLRQAVGMGIDMGKILSQKGRTDPYHRFEKWLETEHRYGARSTFFFWPGFENVSRHHPSDCLYNLSDTMLFEGQRCTVAEMAREMDRRGFEIGLHPSWHTCGDADELKRQKAALEKAVGKEVMSVRQHFLRYDIRVTPAIHAEAGFSYDSTLGFNDNVGFRSGTSYPFRLYDLEKERQLDIMELPFQIQDGAMLLTTKGMRLDEDTAFSYVRQIVDAVESVGGVLNLVWHPHYIILPHWWNLYLRALEYLSTRDPWFGTVSEAGDFFRKENADITAAYSQTAK